MRLTHHPYCLCVVALLWLLVGCNQPHSNAEIQAAMHHYDHLIKTVNADSIALLYTPDGDLGTIAHGQDSIRCFLARFNEVRVLSMVSTTTSIEIRGDSATQQGTYRQVALLPGKDTVRVNGDYRAQWQWYAPQGWRIRRMTTHPAH